MKSLWLALLGAAPAIVGCDAVPDLYAVDASLDGTGALEGAADDDGGTLADVAQEGDEDSEALEACAPVACPLCSPSPGMCCPGGVACSGAYCANECDACAACPAGDVCCSKKNGKPGCRSPDAGACP